MALSVKSKFAGLLRGLLRSMDGGEPARPATAAAPAATSSAPVPAAAPVVVRNDQPTAPGQANEDEIRLPLTAVVSSLPMDLRAKLIAVPAATATISLPVDTVMSQLAFGAVKISFGELRQLAPGIFASTGADQDIRSISLPLHEILSRLNPALLSRRHVQKVEVAEEVSGPFAGRGAGLAFTTQPMKSPSPAPAAEPLKPSAPFSFTPPSPRHTAMPPVTMPLPSRAMSPSLNGNGNGRPPAADKQIPNGNGTNGHAANGNGATKPFVLKISAVPAPPTPPASARTEPAQPTIFAALADLSENWPVELRNEIFRPPFTNASVPLPGEIIEPGLKRGRVAMTWKQIRMLAMPSSAASANDNLELELPLKVIAPLFLAAKKTQLRPQPKITVTADIPDLFFGFPQPAAAPALPLTQQLPKPADTNFYVFGENGEAPATDEAGLRRLENPQTDFMSRQTHPKDVVAGAMALHGVAGAVVALFDGLRVASDVPASLNADTLAAFLPQIFERVNQSTRELRMGILNNVSFTVGNVPWKIFRVNSVYFAAFGRAGEALPTSQLATLAGQLDRKK